MDLPILDTSWKWNYMAYSLLWLPSLALHSDFETHPRCSTCRHGLPSCGHCSVHGLPHLAYPFVGYCTLGLFCPLWLWWLTLLWTFMYKVLGEHVFISFLFWEEELLVHMVTLFLMFRRSTNCFPRWLHHFRISSAMSEGSSFPICLRTIDIVIFITIITAFPVGVKWYVVGILIRISLTTDDGWHVFFFY